MFNFACGVASTKIEDKFNWVVYEFCTLYYSYVRYLCMQLKREGEKPIKF